MPTRRGWSLSGAALGFFISGYVLKIVELTILGVVALVLCIAAVALVSTQRVQVNTSRTLHPPRVHAPS